MKYKINTDVFGGSRIIQELSSIDDNDQVTRLSRWIIDTREADIQKALKQLGWKPPNKVDAVCACVEPAPLKMMSGKRICQNCNKKLTQD